MLEGRFEAGTGRPFVTAYVIFPALRVEGAVSFLMDTGADKSVLMPIDAKRLGIKYQSLSRTAESVGIGGRSSDYVESAQLLVRGEHVLYAYDVDLLVMRRKMALSSTPSLLGRNIMDRWRVTFDKSNDALTIEILSSDAQIRLPPGA